MYVLWRLIQTFDNVYISNRGTKNNFSSSSSNKRMKGICDEEVPRQKIITFFLNTIIIGIDRIQNKGVLSFETLLVYQQFVKIIRQRAVSSGVRFD